MQTRKHSSFLSDGVKVILEVSESNNGSNNESISEDETAVSAKKILSKLHRNDSGSSGSSSSSGGERSAIAADDITVCSRWPFSKPPKEIVFEYPSSVSVWI